MSGMSFVTLADYCETCGGDGTIESAFDGNCLASWAHKYVDSGGVPRLVSLPDRG